MVQDQLLRRGIRDPRVLAAMRKVPRHFFVPEVDRNLAYEDMPLPIGRGQTISQPYIVALMTELLELKGGEKVLEVGTGSGYQAALLSVLARQVFSVERHEPLALQAQKALIQLGYRNVVVVTGDGSRGLPEQAPFDAIVVTASPPSVPPPLLQQLTPAGRLVLPTGPSGGQKLERWTQQEGKWSREDILPVAFVPLIGEFGWSHERPR
jgi:protein-L-isoaspartate(D-aspartate) O-methyltransferase